MVLGCWGCAPPVPRWGCVPGQTLAYGPGLTAAPNHRTVNRVFWGNRLSVRSSAEHVGPPNGGPRRLLCIATCTPTSAPPSPHASDPPLPPSVNTEPFMVRPVGRGGGCLPGTRLIGTFEECEAATSHLGLPFARHEPTEIRAWCTYCSDASCGDGTVALRPDGPYASHVCARGSTGLHVPEPPIPARPRLGDEGTGGACRHGGAHRALCARCAKSRLFSTTGSHGSQGPEFCTLPPPVLVQQGFFF